MSEGRLARLRQSTGVRFIALYLGLNLLAAVPLFLFIYVTTDRLLVSDLQVTVADQTELLRADYARGGAEAVRASIAERVTSGAAAHGALLLVDGKARVLAGNLGDWPPFVASPDNWTELSLYRNGMRRAERIGFSVTRFPRGERLLVGHVLDEQVRLRSSLVKALLGAMLMGIPFGLLGSLGLLHFMNGRVREMAAAGERFAAGDLSTRLPAHGSRDPFDQLAAALNATLDRIALLVNELRVVTDALAHDLRSPLTRMRASVERALAAPEATSIEQAGTIVSREIDNMLRMLNATLEVSRAEAGIGRDNFQPVDLADLARDMCELYEPLAEEQGVTIDLIAPEPVTVAASRELLSKVYSNLIDNALKYGAAGGSIELQVHRGEHSAELSVADRGPGIAPEQRDQALQKYRKLDSARSQDGAGLGLSLVVAVARLHGGSLRLEDHAPGLRVVIVLPLHTSMAAADVPGITAA